MKANTPKSRNSGGLRSEGKIVHSFSFYLLQSGFDSFKRRLREELVGLTGEQIEDHAEDEILYKYYQRGEPVSYVLERICGTKSDP